MIGQSFTSEHEFFGSSDHGRKDLWEAGDPYEDDVEDFDEELEEDDEDDELDDDDEEDDDEEEEEEDFEDDEEEN